MRRIVLVGVFGAWLLSCGAPPQAPPAAQPVAAPTQAPLPATIAEVEAAFAAGREHAAEAGLRSLAFARDPAVRRTALAMLSLHYERKNQLEEAGSTLAAAATEYPGIAPFFNLRRVRVLRKLQRYPDAIVAAEAVVAGSPETSAGESARLELITLDALSGHRDSAARRLESAESISIDSLNEHDFVATADSLEAAGADDLAASLRMRVLTEFPQGRHAERLYQQLSSGPNPPLAALDYAQSLALADRLGRVNRYDQSLDLIRSIEQRFPLAKLDPALRYTRVVALFNSRQYEEVIAHQVGPGEPYYLDTQLRRARAYWRTDRNAEFVKLARSIISRHPKTPVATEAKLLLSKYYTIDEVDYPRATRLLSEVIAGGALGSDGENLWTLGWVRILAKDDAKALATLEDYLRRYPDADYTSNSLFWSGKLHERNGRVAERNASFQRLIALYPYSYFSYRARQVAGLPADAPAEVESGHQFPVEPDVESDHPQLVPIRALMDAGMDDFAAREMQRLASANPGDRLLAYTLADLYAVAGEPLKANVLLQRSFRDIVRHGGKSVPRRFWEILYPMPYRETIEEAAKSARVDPFLLAAVTRQESGFNPDVVSNAGAVGLMQIMPQEASRIATAGGLPPITRSELFDPAKNIRVGAAEIRQKLDAMNGNQTLAMASYNAGEQAVGRWIARTPIGDLDLFIESIPYSETRLYVKSVTRNLFEYRRIYGQ